MQVYNKRLAKVTEARRLNRVGLSITSRRLRRSPRPAGAAATSLNCENAATPASPRASVNKFAQIPPQAVQTTPVATPSRRRISPHAYLDSRSDGPLDGAASPLLQTTELAPLDRGSYLSYS